MTTDRRRVNGPKGGTNPPVFAPTSVGKTFDAYPRRTRPPNALRNIFLKTGLTPSASGSAYLELQSPNNNVTPTHPPQSALKLTCSVHGPRPLPRSAPFTPHLLLSTRVKFAPFACRLPRGYVPDYNERDLAAHLETALRGVLIGERWPKSGVDVIVTVLEGEDDFADGRKGGGTGGWGMMILLSGCITVASAAISDAGIDCVDLVSGGVAALVREPQFGLQLVLDMAPSEHEEVVAACVVGYSQSRDEITELWTKGLIDHVDGQANGRIGFEQMVDNAVEAAMGSRRVLVEAVKEGTEARIKAATSSDEKVKA